MFYNGLAGLEQTFVLYFQGVRVQLKPCPFRQVDGDGNILCDKIKTGDRAVSPNICRACPIAAIQCTHLRATLAHQAHPPVIVRYGNGKTEVWQDPTPPLALDRAACAEKVMPIYSPRDCAGCPLRVPLTVESVDQIRRNSPRPSAVRPSAPRPFAASAAGAVAPAPPAAPVPAVPAPMPAPLPVAVVLPGAAHTGAAAEQARSSIVAQKIIKLQEWLEKQKRAPRDEDSDAVRPITLAAARSRDAHTREEKSVGWTD